MSDDRAAIVTGATGFVGSHLVRRLVRDAWSVTAIVRPTSDLTRLGPARGGVTTVLAGGSAPALAAALTGQEGATVFHLATHFVARHEPADVQPIMEANVAFASCIAEAVCRVGVRRFVNVSSAWQHYRGGTYDPVSLYAASKQAFLDVLTYYARVEDLAVADLTLFDTYGPDDPRRKLLHHLGTAARTGETLAMSSGRQLIDLVHVDDVVEALLVAADAPLDGPVTRWAVSSGAPVSVRELVERYGRAAGRPVPVDWGARPDRGREMLEPWDIAPPPPGWLPRIGLDEGLAATFA